MHFEITRVYREIIEDVTRSLQNDCESLNMTHKEIFDLKALWTNKLRHASIPDNYQCPKLPERCDFDSSSEFIDESLEAQYPNYMMCLYLKVDKSKHKWKVKLKQGFLNIGRREYAFDNAHGDLIW